MDYIDDIAKAIEHIEGNLTGRLTLEEVAARAGYSPYHFQRLFHARTGEDPFHLHQEAAPD